MSFQTLTISISGMTCAHCSRYVSNVIGALNGILQTDISLEKGTATVQYNPDLVSGEQIVAAVSDTHYTVLSYQ